MRLVHLVLFSSNQVIVVLQEGRGREGEGGIRGGREGEGGRESREGERVSIISTVGYFY